MSTTKTHIINLDLPPSERWKFLTNYKQEIDDLLECYLYDLSGDNSYLELVNQYRKAIISETYNEEIDFIASISKFSSDEVMLANLYYDVLKLVFGCTAFAYTNGHDVFHARNLDWATDDNLLSKHSTIFDFQKSGKTIFKTIGWPGFIGVLSGTKSTQFSITLNAIISDDPPELAYPISFLLRDVLEQANSYEEAKNTLENTPIVCDCLLLLSGTQPHEMVVIERTPTRFASRTALDNFIVVTNDYKKLTNHTKSHSTNILQATSCERYDRTIALLKQNPPTTLGDCTTILNDEKIKMLITVQQMAFNNKTGDLVVIKT